MTDLKHIFEKCKKNDRKAQRFFFEHYKSRVMGLCKRYTSSREEAEDVFQESFLKIFKNIKKANEFQYLDRWVIRTTINTGINYYHKNKRHHDYLGVEDLQVFDETDSSVIDTLSNDELIRLIGELPAGYKIVFNLYVIEGYKHHEIAEMLSVSENTSKSQLSRAKALLKQKLKSVGIKKFEHYG